MNHGENAGNQGRNAGNQGGNAGNQGGNTGNQGENTGRERLDRHFTRLFLDKISLVIFLKLRKH